MKTDTKIIFGRDNICRKYEFGKDTFYYLIEKGAPIKIVNNRYMVHIETLEIFLKNLSKSTS